jgi:hypothetical protein
VQLLNHLEILIFDYNFNWLSKANNLQAREKREKWEFDQTGLVISPARLRASTIIGC